MEEGKRKEGRKRETQREKEGEGEFASSSKLRFCTFLKTRRTYCSFLFLEAKLVAYNLEHATMNLVLFDDAVHHVCRSPAGLRVL